MTSSFRRPSDLPLLGTFVQNKHGHQFLVIGVSFHWRPDSEAYEPVVELLESYTNNSHLAVTTWPSGRWRHGVVGIPFSGFVSDFSPVTTIIY